MVVVVVVVVAIFGTFYSMQLKRSWGEGGVRDFPKIGSAGGKQNCTLHA